MSGALAARRTVRCVSGIEQTPSLPFGGSQSSEGWRHRAGHFQPGLMRTVIMDTQVLGGT